MISTEGVVSDDCKSAGYQKHRHRQITEEQCFPIQFFWSRLNKKHPVKVWNPYNIRIVQKKWLLLIWHWSKLYIPIFDTIDLRAKNSLKTQDSHMALPLMAHIVNWKVERHIEKSHDPPKMRFPKIFLGAWIHLPYKNVTCNNKFVKTISNSLTKTAALSHK